MSTKRQTRCGYCWQPGHNRLKCPKMQNDAANGDDWAKRSLEKSKLKKCSYCKETDHIRSTCNQLFNDQLDKGWGIWAGINAAVSVVKEHKIAKGAFMYGPIMHRWHEFPTMIEDRKNENQLKNNYEMINFVIADERHIDVEDRVVDEVSPFFEYQTLAEPEDSKVVLKRYYSLPGFYAAVVHLDESFSRGKEFWLKKNSYYDNFLLGRQNAKDYATVVVPASDEEVEKLANKLLEAKPLIVNFTDRKEYHSALRKMKKESTSDKEIKDLSDLLGE